MLTRVHIQGFKSLQDVEVKLTPLALLFGANASGKSNFLDALQLLSKTAASRTLIEAFAPPYRGKPLESFTLGDGGIRGLLARERLTFAIEADLRLSDAVVVAVNREIQELRPPGGADDATGGYDQVRERNLRYRVEIEMIPRAGSLRVADEYLAALDDRGEPAGQRQSFIERQGEKIHLRPEGKSQSIQYERHLDRTILSMSHYPPHHPHLTAARRELESWLFFYFEPRERMRAATPVREVRHPGLMGEELAASLNTLKAREPRQFQAVEKALRLYLPDVNGIEIDVNDIGEVELRLKEKGVAIPARVMSEGTLRMLGMLSLPGAGDAPPLVGLEEPETGVHPRQISLVAEYLNTHLVIGQSQFIVTTHSPILPDLIPDEFLFVAQRKQRCTDISHFTDWGPLNHKKRADQVFNDRSDWLPVSERMVRGDFDA